MDLTKLDRSQSPIIWITLINDGYIEYTLNFLKSMELAGVSFKLIVFCTDDVSLSRLNGHDNCICFKADFLKHKLPSDLKHWGNMEYKKIVFAKLDAIQYMLENISKNTMALEATKCIGVGYIDTDIVLFSDPTDIIVAEMAATPDINIFAQCDEVGKNCSNALKCKNICTGVIVFRTSACVGDNSVRTIYPFLKYTDKDIVANASDQHYLCHTLACAGITCKTVKKSIFINGGYYHPEMACKKVVIPAECCLIHFNYIIGDKKKKSMRLQEMWYI